MNAFELRVYRDALSSKLAELQRIEAICPNCAHFAHAPTCAKFGAVPPEEFQRTPEACADWEFDGIPF